MNLTTVYKRWQCFLSRLVIFSCTERCKTVNIQRYGFEITDVACARVATRCGRISRSQGLAPCEFGITYPYDALRGKLFIRRKATKFCVSSIREKMIWLCGGSAWSVIRVNWHWRAGSGIEVLELCSFSSLPVVGGTVSWRNRAMETAH